MCSNANAGLPVPVLADSPVPELVRIRSSRRVFGCALPAAWRGPWRIDSKVEGQRDPSGIPRFLGFPCAALSCAVFMEGGNLFRRANTESTAQDKSRGIFRIDFDGQAAGCVGFLRLQGSEVKTPGGVLLVQFALLGPSGDPQCLQVGRDDTFGLLRAGRLWPSCELVPVSRTQ